MKKKETFHTPPISKTRKKSSIISLNLPSPLNAGEDFYDPHQYIYNDHHTPEHARPICINQQTPEQFEEEGHRTTMMELDKLRRLCETSPETTVGRTKHLHEFLIKRKSLGMDELTHDSELDFSHESIDVELSELKSGGISNTTLVLVFVFLYVAILYFLFKYMDS